MTRPPLPGTLTLASALAVLAVACNSESHEGGAIPATETTTPAPAVTVSPEAAARRRVTLLQPRDGAEVGSRLVLTVDVKGFELRRPNGDTSGATGHLHAYIDRRSLPPAEQIIPSGAGVVDFWSRRVTLTGLPPGRHTITVVASDGYRVPFAPPVFDRVTVTAGRLNDGAAAPAGSPLRKPQLSPRTPRASPSLEASPRRGPYPPTALPLTWPSLGGADRTPRAPRS